MYQITDICFDLDPTNTFEQKKEEKISYMAYYLKKYNIQIKEKRQPLIHWRDKRNPNNEIYLVPELCSVTGLNEAQRANFNRRENKI